MNKLFEYLTTTVSTLIGLAIMALIFGLPMMLLWNWLMPLLFGLVEINFWQAIGVSFFSGLLFKNNITIK